MNKGKLYRNPNGKFMGVCLGISQWLSVDVGIVRLGVIVATFMSGGVVFFVYLALGIFLPIGDEYSDRRFKSRVTVDDVKNEFDNLKSRVSKMEDSIFNKERDWDERFKRSDS